MIAEIRSGGNRNSPPSDGKDSYPYSTPSYRGFEKKWKPFYRCTNAKKLIKELPNLPPNWKLTPLEDKSPKRKNWENEAPIPRGEITTLIWDGVEQTSKKGQKYRRFASGYGLRTGEISNGLLAIDVDGTEELLLKLSAGDIPHTVSWTSGKERRYQLLYQIPTELREKLKNFTRRVVKDENKHDLDFRYNGSQSCLPPSRHPDTGEYKWINSPTDTPVAVAPQWLCDLLISFVEEETKLSEQREQERLEAEQRREQRKRQRLNNPLEASADLEQILEDSVSRLQEDIYSWSGHKFKKRGRNELVGFCPVHGGTSGTSFQINLFSFEWYCQGCGVGGHAPDYYYFRKTGKVKPRGKDFVDVVKEIAADAGVEIPESKPKNKQLTHQEWWQRFGLPKAFKELGETLKRRTSRFWRFYKCKKAITAKPPTPNTSTSALVPFGWDLEQINGKLTLHYHPGQLPTREQWIKLGQPIIQFSSGQRIEVIYEAQAKGWLSVFDRSLTGLGKSHDTGNILLGKFSKEFERIFYVTDDAANPTTATVEREFVRLETRHNGLRFDPTHKTALGQPFIRRVKDGESVDIPGNCPETDTFNLLREEKGFPVGGGKDSPICSACPLFSSCEFLSVRAEQLNRESFLRSHPDQLPAIKKTDIGIIDEVGKILKHNKNISFKWNEILATLPTIYQADSELYNIINSIFLDWNSRLSKISINPKGTPHIEVTKILGEARFIASDKGLIDLVDVAEKFDDICKSNLNEILSGHLSVTEKQELIKEKVFVRWFSLIVNTLTGNKKGNYITIYPGLKFVISHRFNRHKSKIKNFGFLVFLDTTSTKLELCQTLDIAPDEILEIQQESPNFSNLTINIVQGVGSCGMQRESEGQYAIQNRINNLIAAIRQKHGNNTPIIDFKKITPSYEGKTGHWFLDNRGSNAFVNDETLIAIGKPIANLNALAAEFKALTGLTAHPTHLEGKFGEFVKRKVEAELIQALGRLRAHLQPERAKTIYLATNLEEGFARRLHEFFPGATINIVPVYELCPTAAKKGEQRERGLVEAMWATLKAGENPTTQLIASRIGVTRSRVSQMASDFNGFENLKGVLISLIEILERKTNTLSDLSEEALHIAREYLPQLLADYEAGQIEASEMLADLLDLALGYGWKTFKAILAEVPAYLLPKLLILTSSVLGLSLPPPLIDEPIAA